MEQQFYETKKQGFRIRKASAQDAPQVLYFIRALAEYEGMADQVTGTETELADSLQSGKAECVLGEHDGIPVGFALFFYHYSTFLCNAGLYLEDLFVLPEYRGRGLGKELLRCVARIARERGVWNGGAWTGTSPALIFTSRWEPSGCPTGQPIA